MTELQAEIETTTPKAVRKPRKKRKAAKAKVAKAAPKEKVAHAAGEFAGVTATRCCDACTAERCVISTIAVCAHPLKTNMPGAGPKTQEKMQKVRRLIKHQMIEAAG